MDNIIENDNPGLGLTTGGNNGSVNIFECLAKSNYSAKELSILLQINNLLEMRLLAYSEAVKINGFSEREIYRDNIGRITSDLKELAVALGVENFYHQVMHIDLRPN